MQSWANAILFKQVEVCTFFFFAESKQGSYPQLVRGMQMFSPVTILSQEAVIDVLEDSFDNSPEWSMWNWIASVAFFSYFCGVWLPGDGEGRNTTHVYFPVINEN